jgi:hypothetical protein
MAWRAAPGAWRAILARASKLAGADPVRAVEVLSHFPELDAALDGDSDSDTDEFLCGRCAEVFSSAAGATIHRLKAHPELPNLPMLVRQSVAGTVCLAFHKEFHQRLRVLHHLRRRRGADRRMQDPRSLGRVCRHSGGRHRGG